MPATTTKLTPKQMIDAAKAPMLAYGDKNWQAVRASITPTFVYHEVATERTAEGTDAVIALFQEWASAMPDSKAKIHEAYVSGNTVVIECTWHGTHKGPLNMPSGPVPATGKKISVKACSVFEIVGGKAAMQRQYFDMATMFRQLGIAGS